MKIEFETPGSSSIDDAIGISQVVNLADNCISANITVAPSATVGNRNLVLKVNEKNYHYEKALSIVEKS